LSLLRRVITLGRLLGVAISTKQIRSSLQAQNPGTT
jgi:hypothetical protein